MHNPILALYSAEAANVTECRAIDTWSDACEAHDMLRWMPTDEELRSSFAAANAEAMHYARWADYAVTQYNRCNELPF